ADSAPDVTEEPLGRIADRRFVAALARRRFDAAIVFSVCTQSALPAALMCRLAGIPLRLAYSRENPYALLTDCVRDTETLADGMRHEVQRQLDLVHSVGFETRECRLTFACHGTEASSMQRKLHDAGAQRGRPYVVVHPGSSAASRRYPAERFGRAAARVARATGAQIVYAGGAGEQPQVDSARAAMGGVPSVSLAGALNLGELAALIAGARVLICNNSGPAHIAAALDTPVVVLYALTNPQHTPWQVASRVLNHDVPCRNCLRSVCPQGHHACLLRVEPEAVAHAALELFDARHADDEHRSAA
ncbi:MAG TPA: glycosyltransferase family 9 protein, partial [Burkholderiaceae bacterium]